MAPTHRPYFSRTRRPQRNLLAEFVHTTLSIVGRLGLGPQPSPRQTCARLSLAVRKLLECFAVQDGPGHVAALGGQEQNGRDHIGKAAVRLVGGALSARSGQSPVDPQIGPVHEAALVAGEEQGSGRNLIRAPDPTERDLARRLDEQPAAVQLDDDSVPAPASSGTGLRPEAHSLMAEIEVLPEGEREAFDLVRIQGMSQSEAARMLGVSVMTVHRRLGRGLQRLAATLGDLYPGGKTPGT